MGAPADVTLRHWIDGAHAPSRGGEFVEVHSPVDGRLVARTPIADDDHVAAAVASAAHAQPAWRALAPAARSEQLLRAQAALRDDVERLVALERAETGKPESLALEEMLASAEYFGFYAAVARTLGGDTFDVGGDRHVYTVDEPFGVVAVITPWNYSVNQAARSIAPALAAGNAVVLKPSEWTSAATVAMAETLGRAGLAPGLLNVICGDGRRTGAALVVHPQVRRVSFTGSVVAGRRVAALAAQRLIPCTLELGGKSPLIVFADAELDRAAEVAVSELLYNTGQTCSAPGRLLIQETVHEAMVARILAAIERADVEHGPIITAGQFTRIRQLLATTAAEGGVAAVGGSVDPDLNGGRFLGPAVYPGVDPKLTIAREEVFGPVLVTIPFDDERRAIELANDSPYGLAAGVWTHDLSRALRVAGALQAGQVYINGWGAPIEAPFGGVKDSGYGREKGQQAVREYTQTKTVCVSIERPS